jgi:hypothetical protein
MPRKVLPFPKSWGDQVFWCNKCDQKQVKSEDSKTGTFFMVSGQLFRSSLKDGPKISDDYETVVFALCPDCDK